MMLLPYAIEGLKAQQERIETLEGELAATQKRQAELDSRLAALEAKRGVAMDSNDSAVLTYAGGAGVLGLLMFLGFSRMVRRKEV